MTGTLTPPQPVNEGPALPQPDQETRRPWWRRRGVLGAALAILLLVGVRVLNYFNEDESQRDETTRNEAGEVVERGELGVFRIEVGDCLFLEPGDTITSVEAVPCSDPHEFEVYARYVYPYDGDAQFPGEQVLEAQANEWCMAQFEGFVGEPYETSQYDIGQTWPQEEAWNKGVRHSFCLIYNLDGSLITGTARDTQR